MITPNKMNHMSGVADHMRRRALAYGVDPDIAYVTGYLHDVGYLYGRTRHEHFGSEILRRCQIQESIASAVELHANLLEELPPEKVSPLLVLLVEADLSVDASGKQGSFSVRLKDILNRYGKDTIGEVNGIPIYESVRKNMQFVCRYCADHHIPIPDMTDVF